MAIADYDLSAAGLRQVLREQGTADFQVVPLDESTAPEVILYGLDEAGQDEHDARLHQLLHSDDCAVVVTYWNGDSPAVAAARRCGANAFMSKQLPTDALVRELGKLLDRPSDQLSQKQGEWSDAECSFVARVGLSPRELDVLALIGAGCTNAEMAERLYVSINTVKSHVKYAYAKLGVNRRVEAVIWVRRVGLQPTEPSDVMSEDDVAAQ